VLTLPALALVVAISLLVAKSVSELVYLLPAIITIPVSSLVPCLGGRGIPLSLPTQEAKSVERGAATWIGMLIAFAFSGLGIWAHYVGWLTWLLTVESLVAIGAYSAMRASIATARWSSLE
jgi:hypothetical protein